MYGSRKKRGFTLIELMIVVSIVGVLASIAIPAYSLYLRRSRASEAYEQLRAMFSLASSYYTHERADPGVSGAHRIDCVVGSAHNNITPSDEKQPGDYSATAWKTLGYAYAFSYYRYEIVNTGGARCGVDANTANVYTFQAFGDLDSDGVRSTFELWVASNGENELYHARGFHTANDTE